MSVGRAIARRAGVSQDTVEVLDLLWFAAGKEHLVHLLLQLLDDRTQLFGGLLALGA